MNMIRIGLSSMKKKSLKEMADHMHDLVASIPDESYNLQWYIACIDLIECKIYKHPVPKPKKKPPENICHVLFDNKGLDFVNLQHIFKEREVGEALPNMSDKFVTPTVVYTLTQPVRSKLFNFNKFVAELDIDSFVSDNTSLPCSCESSSFKDAHHGHILTGDLRIVNNSGLRKKVNVKRTEIQANKTNILGE